MLSIVVAISENNVIGKNNKLLWHIPEDMKRFRELTTGHTIIMGRKTFESLGKVLPDRKHIVLTRDLGYVVNNENVKVVNDINLLENFINMDEECFIIGGAIIYSQFIKKVDKIYMTKIHKVFDGDAYFPKLNESEWEEVKKEQGLKNDENPYEYEFITYIRKK